MIPYSVRNTVYIYLLKKTKQLPVNPFDSGFAGSCFSYAECNIQQAEVLLMLSPTVNVKIHRQRNVLQQCYRLSGGHGTICRLLHSVIGTAYCRLLVCCRNHKALFRQANTVK